MARAPTAEAPDSNNEPAKLLETKLTNSKTQSMAPAEQTKEVADESEEGSGGEESEYEIESIVDAKRGGPGFSYLVSWKGYGPEHNSWVSEDDAGNATDLIAEYWMKHSKDKKSRKSLDKPKSGRKSVVRDASAEVSTSGAKKRGRKVKDGSDDVEVESGGSKSRVMKRARKNTGDMISASMDVDVANLDDVGEMENYMELESWEKLIKSVDTVEKGDDDQLYVYFTLKTDGERHRQRSDVCKQRFPLHLINFYEQHLRWKQIDEADTDA